MQRVFLSKTLLGAKKKGAISDLTRPEAGLAGTSEVQIPTVPAPDHSGGCGGSLSGLLGRRAFSQPPGVPAKPRG